MEGQSGGDSSLGEKTMVGASGDGVEGLEGDLVRTGKKERDMV